MKDWSAAELKQLTDLAGQGLSAGKIAAKMPGRSRNAVIGKLGRGKGSLGRLHGQPKNQAIGRATPKTETPAKRKYRPARPVIVAPPIEAPVDILFESPPCAQFSKSAEPVANLPAPLPITFLEAVYTDRCLHYACDWFAPDGPDMPVCGAERAHVLGTRYCRRHLVSERQPRVAA